ncbi:MAG: LysR substrate-binding domain-containing protein [Kiloniellales bacterium]
MARRYYNLPPLTALAAFEVAARHGSFKGAAAELNVTPGAVSHQIKALEQELGCALFERTAKGTLLTLEGHQLEQVLARSFRQTAAVVERLRVKDRPKSVTIGATTAVAALWLMPRITRFWRSYPDLRVDQHASDLEQGAVQPHLDLRIRYGAGAWPEEEATLLFDDEIMPLCSPRFAEACQAAGLEDLAALPLIHLHSDVVDWTTWSTWFQALGYEGAIERGLVVNNYMIALQVAEEGNGVCLGWDKLTRPHREAGRLVSLSAFRLEAPGSFYLTWSRDVEISPEAKTLRDWLVAESQVLTA